MTDEKEWTFFETKTQIVATKLSIEDAKSTIDNVASDIHTPKNRADLTVGELVALKIHNETQALLAWHEAIKKAPKELKKSWRELGFESGFELDANVEKLTDAEIEKLHNEYIKPQSVQNKKAQLTESQKVQLKNDGIEPEKVTEELAESWKRLGI